jgi:hypothetical protein
MEEVSRDDLEVNKEYYIVPLIYDINNNIVEKLLYKHIAIFKKNEINIFNNKITHFSSYRKLKDKDTFAGYDVNLNMHFKIYQKTSPKIQEQWEKRTINLVLQNIIEDQWFYWA